MLAPIRHAALVQVRSNLFRAHLLPTMAVQVQVEDGANDSGFCFINGELFLLAFGSGNIEFDFLVAEGWTRAIEVALPRILFHGA
ncbi:MAG TPA: hypothetical protein VJ577_02670 [Burkholderiaceae bacterium]|nr:hypothetical protein [Burkholderiaceae bacterium]